MNIATAPSARPMMASRMPLLLPVCASGKELINRVLEELDRLAKSSKLDGSSKLDRSSKLDGASKLDKSDELGESEATGNPNRSREWVGCPNGERMYRVTRGFLSWVNE